MSLHDSLPTPEQIAEARDRGYATQAAINGVDPDAVVNHMPAYRSQCDERSGRLEAMHKQIPHRSAGAA